MAVTRLQGKQYIARALGAEGNTTQLSAAQDALFAAIEEWNLRRDWNFLRMDTSDGFSVAACTIVDAGGGTGTTVNTTTTNGFAGVNVGMTVAGTGVTVGTTVASITDVDTIVLSAAATAATVTLTFTGDVPLIAGTDTYNLPTPIKRPLSMRVVSGFERNLVWKDQYVLDYLFQNQTTQATPVYWSTFNKTSFTQTRQNGRVKVFPIPDESETARVRYFRPIAQPSADGDNLDLPDRYVYALLELGRWYYLKNHDSETARLEMTERKAKELYVSCMMDDEGESIDRDVSLIPQTDHSTSHQIITDEVMGWP